MTNRKRNLKLDDYKIGDLVRSVQDVSGEYPETVDYVGRITSFEDGDEYPIAVNGSVGFVAEELELLDRVEIDHRKFTI